MEYFLKCDRHKNVTCAKFVPYVRTKAPKSTKNYYSNNRQNKKLLFDQFCRLFDFVDYDYLSNNRQKNGTLYLWSCLNKLISSANRQ